MIFNSRPNITNLLESPYSMGNAVFSNDILYTPTHNSVTALDLTNNRTRLLPIQNPHTTALIAISPNATTLLVIDFAGHATIFNLKGDFVIGEFSFKGPVRMAVFSPDGKMLGVGQEKGFSVYECSCLYRSFEPLVLIKKYKTRHSGNIRYIDFSPDSRFLITSGEDDMIFLNNLFPI